MSELHIDHGDLKHGFAIGKAQRLQDWEFRRDEKAFEQLCNRLKVAKWYREVKAEGGERWARVIASWHASAKKQQAKKTAAKRAKWEASIKVGTCPQCENAFRGGQRRKYCSPACASKGWEAANREHITTKQRERRRAIILAAKSPLTCAHCGGVSLPSIRPRKFCTRKCAKADYRRRHATDINERQNAKYRERTQEHAPA